MGIIIYELNKKYSIGRVRNDIIGLINLIYKNLFLKFNFNLDKKDKKVYILLNKMYLRSFLALLRYSSFFFGTIFHDLSGFQINNLNKNIVVYIFYLSRWDLKLIIFINIDQQINLLSEFFVGASWAERECSEMLGINFWKKIDTRKLLLDYVFEGYPLTKQFDVVGYEEIEYNNLNNWIMYNLIQIRDEKNIW